MSLVLSQGQIDDLLIYCGSTPRLWKDDECLVCCPVHGESNPSMGISADKQVCHCFACDFAGDFAKLLIYSNPEEFGFDKENGASFNKAITKARRFLADRYELEYHEIKGGRSLHIKRYGQTHNKYLKDDVRPIQPRFKLAPYMSGKETYQYFYQRGFTKEDVKTFMIGRDVDNQTVTIPVFYEDNTLAGIIGRYIDKNRKKNQRYKIYDNFERSNLLYPLNIAKPKNGEIILVEGQFDAIRMIKLGYTNTFAMMTSHVSEAQVKWIAKNCNTVIYVGDNDSRGREGRDNSLALLKDKVHVKVVDYPNYGKDVCDWSDEDIKTMIKSAYGNMKKVIRRLI